MTDPWADRSFLRGSQYKTDANLAARQSVYRYQYPYLDLPARVLDLAAPRGGGHDRRPTDRDFPSLRTAASPSHQLAPFFRPFCPGMSLPNWWEGEKE